MLLNKIAIIEFQTELWLNIIPQVFVVAAATRECVNYYKYCYSVLLQLGRLK